MIDALQEGEEEREEEEEEEEEMKEGVSRDRLFYVVPSGFDSVRFPAALLP